MIGKKLGDYEILKTLGTGGFGSVWKAKSQDDKLVAIKILNPQVLENQKVVKKFFHEAMILAKLDHPNICKLLDFFPDGDNYCMVMEFIEGVELKKILQQRKEELPLEIAFKIAKQSLNAFQYAYENGILHRDIKPANIMIDNNGNSKIMDFGIAKLGTVASHDTAASMLSVHYVPPERFDSSKEVDIRSDIYSLGLVFYELFAGKRAFNATETSQVMFCHLNEIPEPPSTFAKDLPPTISDSILKALEKDPEDRFGDFREFDAEMDPGKAALDDSTLLTDEDMTVILDHAAATDIIDPESEIKIDIKKKKSMVLILSIVAFLVIAGIITGYVVVKVIPPEPNGESPMLIHPQDGSVMIHIPEGGFTMGSDKYSTEKPVQNIFIDEYYIDKFLVTNALFKKFVEATQYISDAEKEGVGMVRIGKRWKKVEGASWRLPDGQTPIEGRDDHPVSQVSYSDALAYCQWAAKNLPTEAQWEKAARGPNGNKYPWGNEEPNSTMANFDNLIGTTTPVDKYDKGKSFYGIYDMAGNIYQWCRDWFAKGDRNPKNPTGPENGNERVVKGGSFIEGIESLRSPNRDRYPPAYSSYLFGFRCACEEIK